jgi:hypothetical protein
MGRTNGQVTAKREEKSLRVPGPPVKAPLMKSRSYNSSFIFFRGAEATISGRMIGRAVNALTSNSVAAKAARNYFNVYGHEF